MAAAAAMPDRRVGQVGQVVVADITSVVRPSLLLVQGTHHLQAHHRVTMAAKVMPMARQLIVQPWVVVVVVLVAQEAV